MASTCDLEELKSAGSQRNQPQFKTNSITFRKQINNRWKNNDIIADIIQNPVTHSKAIQKIFLSVSAVIIGRDALHLQKMNPDCKYEILSYCLM